MLRENVDRLKKNMSRYGLDDGTIHKIFKEYPPPAPLGTYLPEEYISEQDEWYRNSLKGALLETGLEEGEVDAVIHDTNDTMLIDGIRTSITRMSSKWLSERTLKRYKIPYMRDPVRCGAALWFPRYSLPSSSVIF